MISLKKVLCNDNKIELASREFCTGCSACVASCNMDAISFLEDEKGFLYPHINRNKCVMCGKCIRSCPVISQEINNEQSSLCHIYAAWNKNEDIRNKSSSGGVFTAIAECVLKNGGVVCGAAYLDGVKHIFVDSLSELEKLRGSKYVQSDLRGVFKKVSLYLKDGKEVLFSGTPCQVDGLYRYLGTFSGKLITVDVVCHGVPSPRVWMDYISCIVKKNNFKVKDVRFRSKRIGWRCQGVEIHFENGKIIFNDSFRDPFFRGFLRNYYLREACYSCKYTNLNRPADITLADFWGYKNDLGYEFDDDRGISMIMINSSNGKEVLKKIQDKLIVKDRDICDVLPFQPTLHHSSYRPSDYEKFWLDYKDNGYEYVKIKYLFPEKNYRWKRFKISKMGRILINIKIILLQILRRRK